MGSRDNGIGGVYGSLKKLLPASVMRPIPVQNLRQSFVFRLTARKGDYVGPACPRLTARRMATHRNHGENLTMSRMMSTPPASKDEDKPTGPCIDSSHSSKKRKRVDDVLTRVAQSSSTAGRGSASGWTTCPLCAGVSQKKYALGRGIAAHLHALHAPWKPLSKVERKKRLRLQQRKLSERNKRRKNDQANSNSHRDSSNEHDDRPGGETLLLTEKKPWDPSSEEEQEWSRRVMEIVGDLEKRAAQQQKQPHVDRNGRTARSYRDSLPPFLQAAADGNLENLKSFVGGLCSETPDVLRTQLETRDRNGSTAEHWAAGGGHLDCLRYLLQLRKDYGAATVTASKKLRRRDGKTSLHFAARNGHVACMTYLLDNGHASSPDEVSGDGTTPLHLACFGGHVEAVEFLLDRGSNLHATNDWNCGCAHWVGMARCDSGDHVRRLCQLLHRRGVSFTQTQKQGHSALHKACQKHNKVVVEWMAETRDNGGAGLSPEECLMAALPDDGGHTPSAIWRSVEGDDEFAKWIKGKFER